MGLVFGVGLAGFLAVCGALADSPARVRVQAEPLVVEEGDTRTVTSQTITGPKGTRTTTIDSQAKESRVLSSQSVDTSSDVTVSGVEDTGLKVERKIFVPTAPGVGVPGGVAVITTNSPDGSNTVISGGPGSVHTESHTTSTRTPKVQVRLGR